MKNKMLSAYQFKITLLDVDPPIWRRIQVDNFITLSRFSAILLAVMGWNNSHLHDIQIGGKKYGMPAGELDEYSKGLIDEKKKKLRDFSEDDLKKFTFTYDFGDGWEHEIELEKVLKFSYKTSSPKCIDGARNCPPDDCGGTHGYEKFLEAIRDSKHPEHDDMRRWIGGKFDPEKFSVRSANRGLLDVHRMESAFDEA